MPVSSKRYIASPSFLTNTVAHRCLSKYSWLTGSRVYPTPGRCSSASQLSHWRRAPVELLGAFLLQLTQSRCFHSHWNSVVINPPLVLCILPPSNPLQIPGSQLRSLSMFASRTWSDSYNGGPIFTSVLAWPYSTSSAEARLDSRVNSGLLLSIMHLVDLKFLRNRQRH